MKSRPFLHPFRFTAALAMVWASLSFGAPVEAQPGHPMARLARRADELAGLAQREAPNDAFTRRALRLARLTDRLDRGRGDGPRLDDLYRNTRRALVQSSVRYSDATLDAWDRVVVGYRRLRRRAGAPPVATRPVATRPPRFRFDGRIGRLPARFSAADEDALFRQCVDYIRASALTRIDEVWIFGQRVRTRGRALRPEATCGLVVLNARPIAGGGQPVVTLNVQQLPILLYGTPEVIRARVRRYLPRVVQDLRVNDMVINGERLRNPGRFWNPQQTTQLVTSWVVPTVQAGRGLRARGRIERIPFRFAGTQPAQIMQQCLDYVRAVGVIRVRNLRVNGQRLRNRGRFWTVDQACQMVVAQAQGQPIAAPVAQPAVVAPTVVAPARRPSVRPIAPNQPYVRPAPRRPTVVAP